MGTSQNGVIARPLAVLSSAKLWPRWMIGALIAIPVFAALAIGMLPLSVVSGDSIFIAVVVTLFVLLLCVGLGLALARQAGAQATIFQLTLLMWWFVLVCEVVFDHMGDTYHTYSGQFASQVYGEALIWVLAFGVLLIFTVRNPRYLRQLFNTDYRWATLLTIVCLASITIAPSKMYSAGWGFKLLLCVLLVRLAGSLIQTPDDLVAFMKANLWGFLVLTVGPVLIAFSDPSTAFDGVGGRLNADPDALSGTAAYFLVLCLLMNAIEKKKIYLFLSFLAAFIMLLAFGKAGIIAGVFGATVFFLMQKKVGRTVGVLLGIALLGLIIVTSTSLGDHLRGYQGASTFTGRTVIWAAAIQGIRQKPLIGHGYLSSYFAWVGNDLDLSSQYNHLESSFMELAYNNGLIGLGLMLALQWAILRNTFATMRITSARRNRFPGDRSANKMYLLAVGMLAIYVTLFLASLVNSSLGGRAMSPYMLCLCVLMVAVELRRLSAGIKESPER